MKRLISIFSIISFSLIGCGGGGSSSKESKVLLQKILQVVGIPYEIVVNICQDSNKNGICEAFELQTKITLSKGDRLEDIFDKIRLTEDGKYFLETADPTKPILLELQDRENVIYNDGKFTLPFSGFKTYENNETKELSILTSMVDNGLLSEIDIEKIRNLDNSKTQDKFYALLLSSLEDNLNRLLAVGVDVRDAILVDLKKMSNGLIADGIRDTLPEDLNYCGFDMECVDNRLKITETKISMTPAEIEAIEREYVTSSNTNSSTTQNKLLVSKEIEEDRTYDIDGRLVSTERFITTYKYEGNRPVSFHWEEYSSYPTFEGEEETRFEYEDCYLHYNLVTDKYIGQTCQDSNGSTSRSEVVYDGDIFLEENFYKSNGELDYTFRVLEWRDNKPTKIEYITYSDEVRGEPMSSIQTIEYSNDNPVRVVSTNDFGEVEVYREFDNRLSPFYWDKLFQDRYYFVYAGIAGIGKNNVIKEVTKEFVEDREYSSTEEVTNIIYNSANMPTKIESVETDTYTPYRYVTTISYEYIELE